MNPTISIKVTPKQINVSNVKWYNDKNTAYKGDTTDPVQFTYDGNKKLPYGEFIDGVNIVRVYLNDADGKTDVTSTAAAATLNTTKPLSNTNYELTGVTGSFEVRFKINAATSTTAKAVNVSVKVDSTGRFDEPVSFAYTTAETITVTFDGPVTVTVSRNGQDVASLTQSYTVAGTHTIDVSTLNAGYYKIIVTAATGVLVNGQQVSNFTVTQKAIDLSNAYWIIEDYNHAQVASSKDGAIALQYTGQDFTAKLVLTDVTDGSKITLSYNGQTYKNVGSYTSYAVVTVSDGNYYVINADKATSLSWRINTVTAKAYWTETGTLDKVDNAEFFVAANGKPEITYVDKNGDEFKTAPTAAGKYTAKITLDLGHDGNVTVVDGEYQFTIEQGSTGTNPEGPDSGIIEIIGDNKNMPLIVGATLAAALTMLFVIVGILVHNRKKRAEGGDFDPDGFHDDAE